MKKRKRGQHEKIGKTKSYILKFAIENWDGFFESDLREYLWKELQIRDKATVNKHLQKLFERGYLLKTEIDNQNYYKINADKLSELLEDKSLQLDYNLILQSLRGNRKFAEFLVERLPLKVDARYLIELICYSDSFLELLVRVSSKNVTTLESLFEEMPNALQQVVSNYKLEFLKILKVFNEEKLYFEIWKTLLNLDLTKNINGSGRVTEELLQKVREITNLMAELQTMESLLFGTFFTVMWAFGPNALEKIYEEIERDSIANLLATILENLNVYDLDMLKAAIIFEIHLLVRLIDIVSAIHQLVNDYHHTSEIQRIIDGKEKEIFEKVIKHRLKATMYQNVKNLLEEALNILKKRLERDEKVTKLDEINKILREGFMKYDLGGP